MYLNLETSRMNLVNLLAAPISVEEGTFQMFCKVLFAKPPKSYAHSLWSSMHLT